MNTSSSNNFPKILLAERHIKGGGRMRRMRRERGEGKGQRRKLVDRKINRNIGMFFHTRL